MEIFFILGIFSLLILPFLLLASLFLNLLIRIKIKEFNENIKKDEENNL